MDEKKNLTLEKAFNLALQNPQNNLEVAENLCKEILKKETNHFQANFFLGILSAINKKFDIAKQLLNKATEIQPDNSDAHNNLGNVLKQIGEYQKAKSCYEKAIQIQPNNAPLHNNLGIVLEELGEHQKAKTRYEKAIQIQPSYLMALNNLGNLLKELGEYQNAKNCYEKTIQIQPSHVAAINNLGNVLGKLEEYKKAISCYDEAIKINPNYFLAHNNKGVILQKLRKFNESLKSYNSAFKINPNYNFLLGKVLYLKSCICDWEYFDENLNSLKDKLNNNLASSSPFSVTTLYDLPELQKKTADIWVKNTYSNKNKLGPISKYQTNKKIRIGYFSADFHDHATSLLIAHMLELHDKSKFELFGFSFGPDKKDEIRKRVSSSFDHFIDVRLKSDEDISKLSRSFKIDIAIDLKGFTTDDRFGIFLNRCAPIQVSYLGYPGTSGTNSIDYIIADKILIPKENQKFFSEKIIYLPNTYQPNDFTKKISKKIFKREEVGLPKDSFVFCCFCQNYKITPNIFDIWMKVLKKIEGSVLWLIKDSNEGVKNLKKEAEKRGVNPDKIIFAENMPISEHLARHKMADLFIDTFPCNAHTTCSDALWSGLPVITLMGQSFASRVSGSLLNAVDLNELITTTEKDYEDLIINVAKDSKKLKIIKNKLKNNRITQPLFNTKIYTNKIESAYKKIYEKYHSDLPLENIEIK